MYYVYYGKELIHDVRGETVLVSPKLNTELNTSGEFTFTINSDHPMYDKLEERNTANPITVWQDSTLLFFGDILEIKKDFYLQREVTCRGALAWLNDSIVRPYSTIADEKGYTAPSSVDG